MGGIEFMNFKQVVVFSIKDFNKNKEKRWVSSAKWNGYQCLCRIEWTELHSGRVCKISRIL